MITFTSRIQSFTRSAFRKIAHTVRIHPKKMAVALFAISILLGYALHGGTTAPTLGESLVPTVAVTSISEYSSDRDSIVLLGEVRSVSQAELRAETSGKITRVNVQAGTEVAAGTILAEIENATERAAILSAQGAVAAAQATLTKVKNGARGEDKASASAQAASAATGLVSARETARTAYTSAYAAAQDALYAKADTFFTNANTVRPSLRVRTADYDERVKIENERVALGDTLKNWKEKAFVPQGDETLDTVLDEAQADLARLKMFLDSIAFFISTRDADDYYTSADKVTDEAVIAAARTGVDAARQSITNARSGLATAVSANDVASLTESKTITGAQVEDIQAAEAVYLQARGALAGAGAALERTLIRTPIAGTVTSLSVSRGDFVSTHQSVAVVAHEGGQEIVANTSDTVRALLTPGMQARVDDTYNAVVTQADTGLDPDTKQARVTIGLTQETSLTNGAYVTVTITLASSTISATTTDRGWYLPITAIKVLPDGLAVFSVDTTGTLVAHPIPEGTIIGDRMHVESGLTSDLIIVTDTRGRIAGERVQITKE